MEENKDNIGQEHEERDLLSMFFEEGEVELLTPEEEKGEQPRTLPKTHKFARLPLLQNNTIQRNLLDLLDEQESKREIEIVSNIPQKITELDFNAYLTGVMAALSDQSYLYHNEKELSGISKLEDIAYKESNKSEKFPVGYMAVVEVSVNDICREGYGYAPGEKILNSDKKAVERCANALHHNELEIRYPNGDIEKNILIAKLREYTRKSDGSKTYRLAFNPIFSSNKIGFGIVPRGAIQLISKNLKEKSRRLNETYYKFLHLLIVTREEVLNISIENLLKRIGLTTYFSKNKKMAVGKLKLLFEVFKEEGFLLEEPNPTIPEDGMYHIKINKSFMHQKRIENKSENQ